MRHKQYRYLIISMCTSHEKKKTCVTSENLTFSEKEYSILYIAVLLIYLVNIALTFIKIEP